MNLSHKYSILGGGALVALCVFYFFVARPYSERQTLAANETKELQAKLVSYHLD